MTNRMSDHKSTTRGASPDLPEELLARIRGGNCVAFVGAGFSAAAGLPSWPALLQRLAEEVASEELRAHVIERLGAPTSERLEEVAQLLELELGRDQLVTSLRRELSVPAPPPQMQRRLELLRGIPFRAVLTTNFDAILEGNVAGVDAYRQVLHAPRSVRSLVTLALEHAQLEAPAPVVKLHGDMARAESVVLSRLDYRRRLYGDATYLGFLRSLFLENTVLYLGFSFTDAYINQLRSETLQMLGQRPEDRPRSYALISDLPPFSRRHLLQTESIEVLPFDSAGSTDFSGFDRALESLHDATNPLVQFGRLIAGRRLLWVDPAPGNNTLVTREIFPLATNKAAAASCDVTFVADAEQAMVALRDGTDWDLVVSHWGHAAAGGPSALQLLDHIRARDIKVPLLVFASPDHAAANKRQLLRNGGLGYYFTWDGLLRGFEHVFSSGELA
jgi:hypothetical protein